MTSNLQPQTPFPPEVQSHAPSAEHGTSTQKQSTNCTNSTNSPISEIREISGCSQKTIGEIREISGPTPKISVIVPVYKVEKYLPECIESVLAQTFTDFELILVDDGSPDNSGAICDAYAARDPRIRVFHKENGGVSSARNLGLDHARGEWIAFVDSDDWIEREMYEKLYCAGTENGADFVWCDYWTESDSMVVLHRQGVAPADAKNIISALLSGPLHGGVWKCLVRSSLLKENKIYFPTEISNSEDLLVFARLARCAKKMTRIPIPLYHYRVNENVVIPNSRILKALSDYKLVLDGVREISRDIHELDCTIMEAFCRHKAQMLRVPAFPTSGIRSLGRLTVPAKNSLTREEKMLLFGFEVFGRPVASTLAAFFRGISFMKTKFRETLVAILRKKYAHDGLSVKILVEDERLRRPFTKNGGGI